VIVVDGFGVGDVGVAVVGVVVDVVVVVVVGAAFVDVVVGGVGGVGDSGEVHSNVIANRRHASMLIGFGRASSVLTRRANSRYPNSPSSRRFTNLLIMVSLAFEGFMVSRMLLRPVNFVRPE
jgi:hypothetical protein